MRTSPPALRAPPLHPLLQHCGKHALHPTDPDARDRHLTECKLRHERLAGRARSSGVECCIWCVGGGGRVRGVMARSPLDRALPTTPPPRCALFSLEPVLAKPNPADRKFGLLSGCSHAFCLGCIRSWRQKLDGGADLDTALRT